MSSSLRCSQRSRKSFGWGKDLGELCLDVLRLSGALTKLIAGELLWNTLLCNCVQGAQEVGPLAGAIVGLLHRATYHIASRV